MNRANVITTAAVACLVVCASAWASPTHGAAAPSAQSENQAAATDTATVPSFEDVDTNHDGKLSRSEIPKDVEPLKALRAHFRDADQDGDGRLTKQEYVSYTSSVNVPGMN